jgi:DNA polymerase-1
MQEVTILDRFDQLFRDPTIQKVGQNSVGFDQVILEETYGFQFVNHFMDTMHAHHTCYLEFPKSLDFLTTFYTRFSNYWSKKETANDKSNSIYNCWDCVVTLECSHAIEWELKSLGMYDLYFNHIHPLEFALARMSNNGMLIDMEERERREKAAVVELNEISLWFEEKYKTKINLDSPKQVKELLYEREKFPIQLSKTKSITTDAEALKKLSKRFPREEVLTKMLRYRTIGKLCRTYYRAKVDADSCIRTSFNPSGTDTGRLSSSSNIKDTGSNLQNVPPIVRPLHIAREGCTFIEGDLSQAETLVVAQLLAKMGYRTLVEKYKDPSFDIHKWAAAGIYDICETEVVKAQRDCGKLSNHSGNYGAGPGVLVSQSIKRGVSINGSLGIDYALSKTILEKRHKLLPGLKKWWKQIEDTLRTTRCLTTIFGRKRYFFGRLDESTYRTAYAFEPQSTVGDLCNRIIVALDKRLPPTCRLVLSVHDSIMIEVPDALVMQIVELFRECARIPLQYLEGEEPLIIPLDIKIGKKWGELLEVDAWLENAKMVS